MNSDLESLYLPFGITSRDAVGTAFLKLTRIIPPVSSIKYSSCVIRILTWECPVTGLEINGELPLNVRWQTAWNQAVEGWMVLRGGPVGLRCLEALR